MSAPTNYPIKTIAYLPHDPEEDGTRKRGVNSTNRAVTAANKDMLAAVGSLAKSDPTIGWVRFAVIIVVVLITVIGSLSLIISISKAGTDPVGTIVSASVIVLGLVYAGLTNPLQTVERDIVYRRWSDMIVNVYLVELASTGDPERAGNAASVRFAALAASYAALASKTGEVLSDMAHSAVQQLSGSSSSTPTGLSVSNPGSQVVAADSAITGFAVTAKGPGTLSYEASGLPDGISLDQSTGKVTGTAPAKDGSYPVTITVTSDSAGAGSGAVSFPIVVLPKSNGQEAAPVSAAATEAAGSAPGPNGQGADPTAAAQQSGEPVSPSEEAAATGEQAEADDGSKKQEDQRQA